MTHRDRLIQTSLFFLKNAASTLAVLKEQDDEDTQIILGLKEVVIHLHIGIELLLKERLMRAHWALIFNDHCKASKELLKSGEFESISYTKLLVTFRNIFGSKTINLIILQELGRERNKIVHFGHEPDANTVELLIHKTLKTVVCYVKGDRHIFSYWQEELKEFEEWLPE